MANFDDRESDVQLPEHIDFVKMRPLPTKQPRYFYSREDGSVFDVSEEEASMIENHNTRRGLRQWGYSDGTACIEYLRNCGYRPGQQIPYEEARKIQSGAYQAELDVAKGKWRRPHHQSGHFDATITNHRNADSIMRSFGI